MRSFVFAPVAALVLTTAMYAQQSTPPVAGAPGGSTDPVPTGEG